MPLHKIKDFDPNYRTHFEDQDVIGYDLYAGAEKVGSVDDLLVDDTGKIRYLIIHTGAWILGKKALLPIGSARMNFTDRHVVVEGLTPNQIEALPGYDSDQPVDYEYEEQVRGVYRPMALETESVEKSASLDYNRDTYGYDRDPGLYELDDHNHQNLRLYEERLITSKTRSKTGEVAVSKHVETATATVSVPIEKERVVIERITPANAGVAVVDSTAFQEGEVTRVEVYEEIPDVRKEAFVREEISVRKEVDRQTVNMEETIRREELDVDTEGQPVVEGGATSNRPKKRGK